MVGGGVTGLVAAHRLAKTGANVRLFEKSGSLGGIVGTEVEDGFLIEKGPDSFVTGKGAVVELAAELGLESDIIPSRPENKGSFVLWEGQLHPLPGGFLLMVPSRIWPLLRSSLLSWRGKVRALCDLVLPRPHDRSDESLGSFVRRRLGSEVLDRIAEPLIAGIHAATPDSMSLRASFPRFLDMEQEHRSLILAARSMGSATPRSDAPSHFSSFRLGMGQLVSGLISAMDEVTFSTDTEVVDVGSTSSGRYDLVLADGETLTVDGVVLAVPSSISAKLLAALVPETAQALRGIEQVSNAAVTLAYRTDELPRLQGSGFVVPSADRGTIRGVSFLSRKWEGRVPGPEYTLVRVFFGAELDTRFLDDHEWLVDTAVNGLRSVFGPPAQPVRHWVRIHESGLHRYTLGHLDRVAQAESGLAEFPGIVLAGAGLYGVGLNECISSGRSAADTVMSLTVTGSTHGGRD